MIMSLSIRLIGSRIMVFKKDHINPYTKQQIQENQQVNLEIVLDASGSMAAEIGGRPMMDIAKQSIKEVVQSMPANSRVGLRVFGHQGDNTDAKQSDWTRIRSNHISGNMNNGFLKGLRIESTRFRKLKDEEAAKHQPKQ